jgi:hypothetical protein
MAATPVGTTAVPPAVERAGSGEPRERRGRRNAPPRRRPRAATEDQSTDDEPVPPTRGRLDVVA